MELALGIILQQYSDSFYLQNLHIYSYKNNLNHVWQLVDDNITLGFVFRSINYSRIFLTYSTLFLTSFNKHVIMIKIND